MRAWLHCKWAVLIAIQTCKPSLLLAQIPCGKAVPNPEDCISFQPFPLLPFPAGTFHLHPPAASMPSSTNSCHLECWSNQRKSCSPIWSGHVPEIIEMHMQFARLVDVCLRAFFSSFSHLICHPSIMLQGSTGSKIIPASTQEPNLTNHFAARRQPAVCFCLHMAHRACIVLSGLHC